MKRINYYIKIATRFLIIAITCIGFANALLRYIGRYLHYNLSSNAFIELQWYLFSIVFLIGASLVFQQNKHIRVDVFYTKFSKTKKKRFNLLGTLFLLIPFCSVLGYLSFLYFENSYAILEQSSEPNGLPRYLIKFFIPLAFVFLGANAIGYVINAIKNKKNAT